MLELIFDNKMMIRWDLESNALDALCEWRNESTGYKIRRKIQVHPDMPELLVTVYARDVRFRESWHSPEYYNGGYQYENIVIQTYEDNQITQVITPYVNSEYWSPSIGGFMRYMNSFDFTIEDINFDGYADIRIIRDSSGNKGNAGYYCFLWDAETQSFVEDETFRRLCNIKVDQETKTITSSFYATGYDSTEEFQYIDGVLTLVREVVTETLYTPDKDGNDGVTYERILIDGDMITVY